MPPLLCPSPVLLDDRFPQSLEQAGAVAVALGNFMELLGKESALHLMTDSLQEWFELWYAGEIDPGRGCRDLSEHDVKRVHAKLESIFDSLLRLVTQRQSYSYRINTSGVAGEVTHPVAWEYAGPQVQSWKQELGRVAMLHAAAATGDKPFAAVACMESFGGSQPSRLRASDPDVFPYQLPIVDPDGVDGLGNAFSFVTEPDQSPISASEALRWFPKAKLRLEVMASGAWRIFHRHRTTKEILLAPQGGELQWRDVEQIASLTDVPVQAMHFLLKHGYQPERKLRLPERVHRDRAKERAL